MLSPKILFTNTAGQIASDPAGFLRITWAKADRTLDHTKALFEELLRQLKAHGESRILIDQKRMHPFNGQEQYWIANEWVPRAVHEGGYRYGAVVVSPAVLARLATAYITTSAHGLPLVYRSFDTVAEALAWLLKQPATP